MARPHLRAALLFALATGLSACGDDDGKATPPTVRRPPELDAVSLKSQRGGTSHQAGSNCMACHGPNGTAPGLFTVAGTAVNARREPNPDATVTLSTEPNGAGTVVLTLEADANGNFYTTEAMPLPEQQLYPRVTSRATASVNFMPFPTMSGACGACHVGSNPVDLD
jgi:mono/diheme cytochrome c family protein